MGEILSFPTKHYNGGDLQIGDVYQAPNGIAYMYDGDKWITGGVQYAISSINIQIDGGYPGSTYETELVIDGGLV